MDHLVTGGGGFIGSSLVRHLAASGDSVRVVDNFSTGRRDNIGDIAGAVEVIEGDIREMDVVKHAVRGVKHVFHLAALPSVPRSIEDPVSSNDVNVCGTVNLLVAARDAGVRRFVFSSSSSVYGDTPVLPKREDMTPAPLSPYAVQKLTCEHYCRIFHSLYGLNTYSLRYFNVFGPRQNPKSQYAAVVPLFMEHIRSGRSPVIHGDGEQTRDFTFVQDAVEANICCRGAAPDAAGGVYNVARGGRISVNELARKLIAVMGGKVEPVHDQARMGDVRDSQADCGRAERLLGWKPAVDLDTGLRLTVEWFMRCKTS